MELADYTDVELLALLIAGEADNQPLMGRVSVACVPVERLRRGRWGDSLRKVMLQPYQFSAFNANHWRNFTHRIGAHVTLAELAIERLLNSPAAGATHYCRYDMQPMPKWAEPQYSTYLGRIAAHVFYREL